MNCPAHLAHAVQTNRDTKTMAAKPHHTHGNQIRPKEANSRSRHKLSGDFSNLTSKTCNRIYRPAQGLQNKSGHD